MQKKFNLDNGLKHVYKEIEKLKNKKSRNIIILIAGGSASGKTSRVAKKIYEKFEKDSNLLSMDNYYRGKEYYEKYKLNFDQPEALDTDLFFEHLKKLKSGEVVKIPDYDFTISKPTYDAIEVVPKKIIIIEGLYSLLDNIAELGDIKIFVDLGEHGRVLRRIFRDVKRTGQKSRKILDYFLETVEPMNDKYIEPTKKNADIIIYNEYDPFKESLQLKTKDLQIKVDIKKYDEKEIASYLLKLGAQYFGENYYNDYFFPPNYIDGRDIGDNEIVFIRNTGFGKYLFTYKGPLTNSKNYEERNIINFYVESDTLVGLRQIYGNNIEILSRKRACYFYFGVLVLIDIFENGDKIVEFKFEKYDKETKNKIKTILEFFKNK